MLHRVAYRIVSVDKLTKNVIDFEEILGIFKKESLRILL